ncbi:hypothetical protein LEMLEM_LOCUS8370 [Lemmus lemmus]
MASYIQYGVLHTYSIGSLARPSALLSPTLESGKQYTGDLRNMTTFSS